MNEDKCFLLPLFLKQSDPLPTQLVNGKEIKVKDKAPYLGDVVNNKGTYKDLIEERVKKARVCTINSMSLCSTYKMGKHTLNSLILLYKTVFIKIVLYNSEAWDNLPQNEQGEEDMLDMAFEPKKNSRLSCQILVSKELDGIVVDLPKKQT